MTSVGNEGCRGARRREFYSLQVERTKLCDLLVIAFPCSAHPYPVCIIILANLLKPSAYSCTFVRSTTSLKFFVVRYVEDRLRPHNSTR